MTEELKPEDPKQVDRLRIQVQEVRNGYLMKTYLGQFIYPSLGEAAQAFMDFYTEPHKFAKGGSNGK